MAAAYDRSRPASHTQRCCVTAHIVAVRTCSCAFMCILTLLSLLCLAMPNSVFSVKSTPPLCCPSLVRVERANVGGASEVRERGGARAASSPLPVRAPPPVLLLHPLDSLISLLHTPKDTILNITTNENPPLLAIISCRRHPRGESKTTAQVQPRACTDNPFSPIVLEQAGNWPVSEPTSPN